MKQLILTVAAVAAMFASCPTSAKCPLHTTMNATFDHVEYPEGKQVYVYYCPSGGGHKFSMVC